MKGDNMNLNEFRKQLAISCNDIIEEVNSIMKNAPVPTKCFPCERFEFSWKPLKEELRKYNFIYSQDDKQFLEIKTGKETQKMEVKKNANLTKIFENATSQKEVSDKISVCLRMSKATTERIDNIIKDGKYNRSEFINEIVEAVLDEYEDEM